MLVRVRLVMKVLVASAVGFVDIDNYNGYYDLHREKHGGSRHADRLNYTHVRET
jgi:hypothetical protein